MTMRRGQHTSGVLRAMDASEGEPIEQSEEISEEKTAVEPEP
jgi:hypothetical protein